MLGFFPNIYLGIFLAPLVGFLINGMLGKRLSKPVSAGIASTAVLIPFLLGLSVLFELTSGIQMINANLYNWFSVGGYRVNYGILLDQLSVLMILIITGVGFLIHVYSIGYMHDDEKHNTYFSYLNLFIFFMLILVMSNNYLGMFIGWEGVGLSSYLLIGFWFKNQDYNNAAKKAFIMNRIGDLGFLLGMFFMFFYVGTLEYHEVNKFLQVSPLPEHIVITIALLFFIGAIGKSAQIPLFTWLPDAMAGPTPVSALIHAATMVTAGIYMIIRSNLLYSLAPVALEVVGIVGIATALYAAIVGLMQNDIKKVLAYSTVSQLGLMFLALGVGAYTTAIFHVMTHAFFKALLFLGAGSVIHAMGGEQDIRKMGGLRKALPITFATFLIGSLAISGIPPFSGFFSKDEILAMAFEQNKVLWILGIAVSMMTAFYMFRLLFLTFFGSFRGTSDQKHHLHESPASMTIPLIALAILATVGGLLGLPHVFHLPHVLNHFLSPVIYQLRDADAEVHMDVALEWSLMGIAVAGALISIALAYTLYIRQQKMPLAEGANKGLGKLIYNKFYIDEIYNNVFVQPIQKMSEVLYKVVDQLVVDGIVNLSGKVTMLSGSVIRSLQTGHVGFYILAMVLSICFIIGYFLILI